MFCFFFFACVAAARGHSSHHPPPPPPQPIIARPARASPPFKFDTRHGARLRVGQSRTQICTARDRDFIIYIYSASLRPLPCTASGRKASHHPARAADEDLRFGVSPGARRCHKRAQIRIGGLREFEFAASVETDAERGVLRPCKPNVDEVRSSCRRARRKTTHRSLAKLPRARATAVVKCRAAPISAARH